ncbi:Maf family protein [Brevibacterium gallinarum]|uniref:Nucleoside triphosphate pyrophosphatase n=2 Tax=Bacteria TaxID=2 RepID=A0ABR8WWZ1_9MICO|nr:Maf family nucleotide pyrophosphatase [Brevibacterium gallinarum]MBD8021111.1 septum formation protein Maf [Brevibacterium gallinarum]
MSAVILASGSPSRYATLTSAGITPQVIVSHVDEAAIQDQHPTASVAELAGVLAAAKGRDVLESITADAGLLSGGQDRPRVLIAADSILELDGKPVGKPHTPARTREVWQAMGGRTAHLHTGHFLARLDPHASGWQVAGTRAHTATTTIRTAALSDAEIDAYIATAEPFEVAGALTIDGFGGAFVTGIEGDHHNVIGLSLPLARTLVGELGLAWHELWDVKADAAGHSGDDAPGAG